MKRSVLLGSCLAATLALFLVTAKATAVEDTAQDTAKWLLETSGVHSGIVIHLGCGDGILTAALHASESFTVHGLDADAEQVAQARRRLQAAGLYGPVSVEHYHSTALPYADNLINLVVMQKADTLPMDEVMRVLAPGGVACIERNGVWDKKIKPWPDDVDHWGHFLHNASNNAVADDAIVAPPENLQWQAGPLWLRSHETPSGIQSPVSAQGRLFYFFDEGLIGITDERLPDRWSLICRDAFNGRLLWKRPLKAWGWRQWSRDRYEGKDWTTLRSARTAVPNENQRRIVADGDRLYTTLAWQGPLAILNAATGDTITTVEATWGTSEILVSDGIALAYVSPRDENAKSKIEATTLVAVQGRTGQVLWQKTIAPIRPLALAIDNGRIVYLSGKDLVARDMKDGRQLWTVRPAFTTPRTLLTVDDVVVMQGGKRVVAHDARNGNVLWQKTVPPIGGAEGDDLFVIDGLVWRGMLSADEAGRPVRKSPHALVIGWDLRSGQEKRRVLVENLRSPEHHHRCYRNKATGRYMISSYEGAEFLDLAGSNHSQNNWIRGACRNGMMPGNGMLYAPPDQCFCQPGAKLLGYTALKGKPDAPPKPVPDGRRLEKGPAYGATGSAKPVSADDWPTLRHDPARRGTTTARVPSPVVVRWRTPLGERLTAPVAAGDTVFVALPDAHTIVALDMADGRERWRFTANGRIDSPPTIYQGMALFGSSDGHVYCLRAADGELAWRFLAAPLDRRIGCFDQIESAWPVHGSVLVDSDTLYFSAGRSTYLDGGITVYALEPATGKLLHKRLLHGPQPFEKGDRDRAFFIQGANSDVLVSEGGFLYMRQKKLTRDLREVAIPVLSSKGAQDVGMHIFSTASLLDGSWYNRTFWMYSKRWPGFQLAIQSPKSGQLLVVDDDQTYAVRVFYRRNVHSPMFFPNTNGYLLFADRNTNEPQIVGEPGAGKPVKWLPQSDYSRARGDEVRKLESEAFGLDKMIGYTRAEPPVWTCWLPVRIRAMVKAGDTVFVAGPPDVFDPNDPFAAFEARKGAHLVGLSAQSGEKCGEVALRSPPVFDGMIAAHGKLFVTLEDNSIVCLDATPGTL